jgi:cytochrome c-type biogenesis protein
MPDLPLALFAGILTIAAPCTLPVLPILLGASTGQRAGTRPAFIAAGFVASFTFVALALNAIATALHFDPDALRTAGLVLLVIFGALMIWPAPFERLTARLAGAGVGLRLMPFFRIAILTLQRREEVAAVRCRKSRRT